MHRYMPALIRIGLLFMLSACQPEGCQNGYTSPSDELRNLTAFNQVLSSNLQFNGLKAVAVHGHDVDVIDSNLDIKSKDVAHSTTKYIRGPGISDNLRQAWLSTFKRLHPNATNSNIVAIWIHDVHGRPVMGISLPQCATV